MFACVVNVWNWLFFVDVSIYLGEEKSKEDNKKKSVPPKQAKKKDAAEVTNGGIEKPRMQVKVGNVYQENHQKAINEEVGIVYWTLITDRGRPTDWA